MGHPQSWTVPGVFFTEAKGMAHLSAFNKDIAGINFTTLDVPGTYVKGGVIAFDATEKLQDSQKLKELELEIISKPFSALVSRAQENIMGCSRFMPILGQPNTVKALGYVPGSRGILGKDKGMRESKEVYIANNGYHAVNLAKGGWCSLYSYGTSE